MNYPCWFPGKPAKDGKATWDRGTVVAFLAEGVIVVAGDKVKGKPFIVPLDKLWIGGREPGWVDPNA